MLKVPAGAQVLLAAALGISPVFADSSSTQTSHEIADSYFGAMPYYVIQDDGRTVEDDEGLGARFLYGNSLGGSSNWYWEGQLAFNALETGVGGFTDYYQYHLGLDYAYRFGDQKGFTPFVLLGVGAVHDDVYPYPFDPDLPTDDETSFFANAGLGFVTGEMGDSGIKFRAEARYVASQFDDGFGDWHIGLGFEVPIGQTKVVTKTVVEEQVKEVEIVKEVTAPAADTDNDGVFDGVDECPNTLAGAKVDARGCAIKEQTIQLEGVFFETGSDQLKPASRQSLRKLATFLQEQPELRVEIAGHTDSTGAASYNQQLSQARADTVKFFLIREGVDPSRLSTRGYGENQPIANNDSSAGRAMNRRVEFRIQR